MECGGNIRPKIKRNIWTVHQPQLEIPAECWMPFMERGCHKRLRLVEGNPTTVRGAWLPLHWRMRQPRRWGNAHISCEIHRRNELWIMNNVGHLAPQDFHELCGGIFQGQPLFKGQTRLTRSFPTRRLPAQRTPPPLYTRPWPNPPMQPTMAALRQIGLMGYMATHIRNQFVAGRLVPCMLQEML